MARHNCIWVQSTYEPEDYTEPNRVKSLNEMVIMTIASKRKDEYSLQNTRMSYQSRNEMVENSLRFSQNTNFGYASEIKKRQGIINEFYRGICR